MADGDHAELARLLSGTNEPAIRRVGQDIDFPGMAKAFGAGFVDPAGVPSWALKTYTNSFPNFSPVSADTANNYASRMQQLREKHPVAAGMGSALIPGLGAGATIGRMSLPHLARGIGPVMGLGGGIGGLVDILTAELSPEQKEAENADRAAAEEKYNITRDAAAKNNPASAMYQYGDVKWPWQIDWYGGRKKDPGVPPLPGVPY